jgi:hypothetical protein
MSFFKKTSVKIFIRDTEFAVYPLGIGEFKKVQEIASEFEKASEPDKVLDNVDKMLDIIVSQIDYTTEAPKKEDLQNLTVTEIKQIFNAVIGNVSNE